MSGGSELRLDQVHAGYGDTDVIRDLSLAVREGECVALLGPNGAGKSTLLRVAAGLLRPSRGRRTLNGVDATGWRPHRFARAGLRWVGEPRPLYPSLTVNDNLLVGAATRRGQMRETSQWVYELLPELESKGGHQAGTLSGGQQQMLAIGQALMSRPRYLCLDEPSLGLAPRVVAQVGALIAQLVESGVGVFWAEQFPRIALERCDRAVVIAGGALKLEASPETLTPEKLEAVYMGMSTAVE